MASPTRQQQDVVVDDFTIGGWPLGINNTRPAEEIDPQEVQDALNVVYDDDDNFVSRPGVSNFHNPDQFYNSRITSLHNFIDSSGVIRILHTTGTQLYSSTSTGSTATNITGSLTFPDNTFWKWVTFDGLAIGANKATSGTNPVKVDNTGTAAALAGSPPKAYTLEVWNNRLWIAESINNRTVLRGSALGDPEDWVVDDEAGAVTIDIGVSEGDPITGLIAFKERLFVFKSKKIYVLSTIFPENFNASSIQLDVYSPNIGCISPYSIQTVLDDVLFLSHQGVASLKSSEIVAKFETALLSKNIRQFRLIRKTIDEIPAFVFDDVSQYVISLPASITESGTDEMWVLDYSRITEGIVRWTRFDGVIAGTAFTSKIGTNFQEYLIGAKTVVGSLALWDSALWDQAVWDGGTNFKIVKYAPTVPAPIFSDTGLAYSKIIETKAFNANASLMRKIWLRFGVGFRLISTNAAVTVEYYFDNDRGRKDQYPFSFTTPSPSDTYGGSQYGTGQYGTSVVISDKEIIRRFKNNTTIGSKSQLVTFRIWNLNANEAFILKSLWLQFGRLTHRGVSDQ